MRTLLLLLLLLLTACGAPLAAAPRATEAPPAPIGGGEPTSMPDAYPAPAKDTAPPLITVFGAPGGAYATITASVDAPFVLSGDLGAVEYTSPGTVCMGDAAQLACVAGPYTLPPPADPTPRPPESPSAVLLAYGARSPTQIRVTQGAVTVVWVGPAPMERRSILPLVSG